MALTTDALSNYAQKKKATTTVFSGKAKGTPGPKVKKRPLAPKVGKLYANPATGKLRFQK